MKNETRRYLTYLVKLFSYKFESWNSYIPSCTSLGINFSITIPIIYRCVEKFTGISFPTYYRTTHPLIVNRATGPIIDFHTIHATRESILRLLERLCSTPWKLNDPSSKLCPLEFEQNLCRSYSDPYRSDRTLIYADSARIHGRKRIRATALTRKRVSVCLRTADRTIFCAFIADTW